MERRSRIDAQTRAIGLAERIVRKGLSVFALYDPLRDQRLTDFLMNTDRALSITTDDLLKAVGTFRSYSLTEADKVSELTFVLRTLMTLNPELRCIVYREAGLTFPLRRFGCVIFQLNGDEIDADYAIKTDEEVFDLFTRDVGLCWNGRGLGLKVASTFGEGRLGQAIRELPLFAEDNVIWCGEHGETAQSYSVIRKFLAFDKFNPFGSVKDEITWLFPEQREFKTSLLLPDDVRYNLRAQLSASIKREEPDYWVYEESIREQQEMIDWGYLKVPERMKFFHPLLFDNIPIKPDGSANPPYFIVLPAGNGKSTIAAITGFRDVDDLFAPHEAVLAPLRRANAWDKLNKMNRAIVSKCKDEFVLIHGTALIPQNWRSRVIFSGKVNREELLDKN